MSERKYRQRGYQDDPRSSAERPKPKGEPVARELRRPNLPGFSDRVKCARCAEPVTPPIDADSRCPRCGVDLRTCAQCAWFDPASRFECARPIPARVSPKDVRNTCAFFEPRVTVERETRSTGPPDARRAFDDLFK